MNEKGERKRRKITFKKEEKAFLGYKLPVGPTLFVGEKINLKRGGGGNY